MSETPKPAQGRIGTTVNEYGDGIHLLAAGARGMLAMASMVDLEAMRTHLATMETIAPLVVPTTYLQSGGLRLRDQATFLDATIAYINTIRTLDRRR
ncbi:hypothetical protein [Streptosporangium sp. CA-115845]|uniref:hypothetical protein n=1 Tax=Streptosporangium sp. CA-115845 TaxID=3240071 RepID=UPI003D902B50